MRQRLGELREESENKKKQTHIFSWFDAEARTCHASEHQREDEIPKNNPLSNPHSLGVAKVPAAAFNASPVDEDVPHLYRSVVVSVSVNLLHVGKCAHVTRAGFFFFSFPCVVKSASLLLLLFFLPPPPPPPPPPPLSAACFRGDTHSQAEPATSADEREVSETGF